MTVKLIRMWSGEDVIADLVEEKSDSIMITNPIVAIPAQQGQIGFAPWSPLISEKVKELEVIKKYVVYISEPQEDIVDQYNQMFSTIATPTKKLILS